MVRGETTFLTVLAGLLALIAPTAHAQETYEDPTVNESDFDTSAPSSDESYLSEGEAPAASGESAADPTLTEGDFDMSVPGEDEFYLDEGVDASAEDGGSSAGRAVPAAGVLAGLGVACLAAYALRQRSRNL